MLGHAPEKLPCPPRNSQPAISVAASTWTADSDVLCRLMMNGVSISKRQFRSAPRLSWAALALMPELTIRTLSSTTVTLAALDWTPSVRMPGVAFRITPLRIVTVPEALPSTAMPSTAWAAVSFLQ